MGSIPTRAMTSPPRNSKMSRPQNQISVIPLFSLKGGGRLRYYGQALHILESAYWNREFGYQFYSTKYLKVFPSSKWGYEAILCFPKSVWGYETFWRFLGSYGGYETFYRFSWKRGHETFSESNSEGTKHFEFFASGV